MNYPDSVQFLYALGNEIKSAKLGLERITAVLEALGNPERAYRVVHVAAVSGIAMTLLTIVSSAVPTGEVRSIWLFEGKLLAGTALMIGTAWLVYSRRRHLAT